MPEYGVSNRHDDNANDGAALVTHSLPASFFRFLAFPVAL